MFHSVLGQVMGGGSQLTNVPPNATRERQIEVLNQIIAQLNNFSRDVVQFGTETIILPAGASSDILTIPHNLGYKPQAFAYLNGVNVSANGQTFTEVDTPLPTYTSAGADGAGHILFQDWLDYFVDDINLYIHWNSGIFTGANRDFQITYYLTRNKSNEPT